MRLAVMNTRERTRCEVVSHVYPGTPGQGTATRTPAAGGAGALRSPGHRAAQAGEAAGARRAPVAVRVAAGRAPALDARDSRLKSPAGRRKPGMCEGRPGFLFARDRPAITRYNVCFCSSACAEP